MNLKALAAQQFWLWVLFIDIIFVVLAAGNFFGGYAVHLLILIHIYLILAVSLNFAIGFGGLLNLGHVALFGIGAYTSAILVKNHSVPYLVALVASMFLASLCGVLLMYSTKKIKQDYLALATLGFSFVVFTILLNWTSLTRGALGILAIPKPDLFGLRMVSNASYLVFTTILCMLALLLVFRISRSPFGRLIEALRDDEVGLMVLGKNTTILKLKCIGISAAAAGLAGSLFAHYITFIDPSSFSVPELILLLTIIIVGGLASNKGSLVGTLLILLIPEILRLLPFPGNILGPLRQIIYALILLLILRYRPRGLFGKVDLQ